MRPLFSFPVDHSLATALPAATIPYNSPPYGNRPRSDRLIWARDESPMNYGGERSPPAVCAVTRALPSAAPATPAAPAMPAAAPHKAHIHPSRCDCFTALPGGNRTIWTVSRRRLARIAPYAFSFRRMHTISPLPGNVYPKCMLFKIEMARSSPYASISRCNWVALDTWRKDLARKVPFPRREIRNHTLREDAARTSRPSMRA